MTRQATLLMDLQRDFLGAEASRMPVQADAIPALLRTANAILAKTVLPDALPILVVNEFPASDRIANIFRHGAAVAGTPGARLDPRIVADRSVKVLAKARPSAFSNPELERLLRAEGVTDLFVMGVFAEGCVRSTVLDAKRRGYGVHVIADAVASNAGWKKQFALWAMKRAGARIVASVHPASIERASA